jgi:hypothetical protein
MKAIFIFFIALFCLSSCRYSLPLVKVRVEQTTDTVASSGQVTTHSRYVFLHISRYGITGMGWKHLTCDPSGTKRHLSVSKRSNCASDGKATTHSRVIEYDARGRKVKKTLNRRREKGWGFGKSDIKIIEYPRDGKKHVTHIK